MREALLDLQHSAGQQALEPDPSSRKPMSGLCSPGSATWGHDRGGAAGQDPGQHASWATSDGMRAAPCRSPGWGSRRPPSCAH